MQPCMKLQWQLNKNIITTVEEVGETFLDQYAEIFRDLFGKKKPERNKRKIKVGNQTYNDLFI